VLAGCRAGREREAAEGLDAVAGVPVEAGMAPAADAGESAAGGVGAGAPDHEWPFGEARAIAKYSCPVVLAGGRFRSFLSSADTAVAFVDGDDWLALVNRSPTGALAPSYAPTDLVDIHDLSPHSAAACESAHACLRRDAAVALRHLFDAMHLEGMQGRVESAFRAFGTQCWVFSGWASRAHAGFCEAATQSALPGHSQHQLGTTVDMFTREWEMEGPVFRDGFGCTRGGKWLDENAWRFGFVVSYPIDPDDRKDGSRCAERWDRPVPIDPKTGYKHEPWHLRYIGVEEAARFHDAWLASDPGSPQEITLEQWLRSRRGLVGDTELPVCDGCECGACATLASDGDRAPCKDASLRLDGAGRVVAPSEPPAIVGATAKAESAGGPVLVEVRVHASPHTPTQTPVTNEREPIYEEGASFDSLVPYSGAKPHRYADLPGAWRVGVEPLGSGRDAGHAPAGPRWPWRASLAKPSLAATWNRANLVLPAQAADSAVRVRVVLPGGTDKLHVTLLRDGEEHGTVEVAVE
jgi:D-alanyl-D-alanine carboxypeptidase